MATYAPAVDAYGSTGAALSSGSPVTRTFYDAFGNAVARSRLVYAHAADTTTTPRPTPAALSVDLQQACGRAIANRLQCERTA